MQSEEIVAVAHDEVQIGTGPTSFCHIASSAEITSRPRVVNVLRVPNNLEPDMQSSSGISWQS